VKAKKKWRTAEGDDFRDDLKECDLIVEAIIEQCR